MQLVEINLVAQVRLKDLQFKAPLPSKHLIQRHKNEDQMVKQNLNYSDKMMTTTQERRHQASQPIFEPMVAVAA